MFHMKQRPAFPAGSAGLLRSVGLRAKLIVSDGIDTAYPVVKKRCTCTR